MPGDIDDSRGGQVVAVLGDEVDDLHLQDLPLGVCAVVASDRFWVFIKPTVERELRRCS